MLSATATPETAKGTRYGKLTRKDIGRQYYYEAYDEYGDLIDTMKSGRSYHALVYWGLKPHKRNRNSFGRPDLLAKGLSNGPTQDALVCLFVD